MSSPSVQFLSLFDAVHGKNLLILPDNRFLSEIQALRLRQGNHGPIIAKLVKIADSPFCLSVCAACYKQVHIIFLLFSLEFSVVNY